DAHAHAWLDVLRGHHRECAYEAVRSRIGSAAEHILRDLAGIDEGSSEALDLLSRRAAIFKGHYLPGLGPLPGARPLVGRIRSQGLRCAVVTTAPRADATELLRAAAVVDLVELVITPDDVPMAIPHASLVEIALERLGIHPKEAVFVGDTPYDVDTGRRAGVS